MTIRNPIPPGSRPNIQVQSELDAIENILYLMLGQESKPQDFYRTNAEKALVHLKTVKRNLTSSTPPMPSRLTVITEDYRNA